MNCRESVIVPTRLRPFFEAFVGADVNDMQVMHDRGATSRIRPEMRHEKVKTQGFRGLVFVAEVSVKFLHCVCMGRLDRDLGSSSDHCYNPFDVSYFPANQPSTLSCERRC